MNTAARPLSGLKKSSANSASFSSGCAFAKDKTEFDAFMAERRNRPEPESPPPQN